MRNGGKIVGLLLGAGFYVPIGAMVGLFVGHLYDKGYFHRLFFEAQPKNTSGGGYTSTQQIFFDTSFSVMGYIAKADGRVSEQEIQLAERIMVEMGLAGEKRRQAINQFNQGKTAGFDYQVPLAQLRRVAWFQPGLVRMFLEIQIQVALANGQMSQPSRDALRRVFLGLGYPERMFNYYERQFNNGYQQQSYQAGGVPVRESLREDYALLGLDKAASAAEVKKSYRRMMSKHHPDRLIAKGMPPEMVKLATQKTQNIKQAYDRIMATKVKG
jgi:DnaJ like chaperone protein